MSMSDRHPAPVPSPATVKPAAQDGALEHASSHLAGPTGKKGAPYAIKGHCKMAGQLQS